MFDVINYSQNLTRLALVDRAAKINAACPNIEVQYSANDAQNDVATQIAETQTVILQKPDVIIFSAVDNVGSAPAIKAAKDAGIKVVDVRAGPTPNPDVEVSYYFADELAYMKKVTDWMESWLAANPGKNLNVGVIYGAAAQTAQLPRGDAIKAYAQTNPDRVKILDEGYGDWLADKSQQLAQNWMLKYPDMNLITTAADVEAFGVANAVVAANKVGQVMVTGVDATDDGVDLIQKGPMTLSVGVLPGESAFAIDIAVAITQGTWTHGNKFTNPNIWAVTKENVDDYLAARKAAQGY
jgi:ABC-type sugar transport system substrate-binding protein